MKRKYILLGKYGKITNYLYEELKYQGIESWQISWEEIKTYGVNKLILDNYKFMNDCFYYKELEVVVIDCLIGDKDIQSELNCHLNILAEIKKIKINLKFIYISTYEPSSLAGTDYRKMKLIMEKNMLKNQAIILRMGVPITRLMQEFFENNKSKALKFCLTNLSLRPLLIPSTQITMIIEILTGTLLEGSIYKCYSDNLHIILEVNVFPKLIFTKDLINTIKFPIPIYFLAIISKYITKILNLNNYNKKISDFLQKFYSIYEHQLILYDKII